MLTNNEYRTYFNKFITGNVIDVKYIHHEGEISAARSKISQGKYVIFVVMPSLNPSGTNIDSIWHSYDSMIFVLTPHSKTHETEASLITVMDNALAVIKHILTTVIDDATNNTCHFLKYFEQQAAKIDPEVNLLEMNGYSMAFRFKLPLY